MVTASSGELIRMEGALCSMPAVIDPSACNRNFDQCFPAKICPETAIRNVELDVVIDSGLCGECPGPCVNFWVCHSVRIRFDIMRGRVLNELSADDALAARTDLDQKRKAESEAGRTVVDLNLETFESTIRDSPVPVIVDFWALRAMQTVRANLRTNRL